MTPTDPPNKSLMRNLGEFFGHIAQGVRSDPTAKPGTTRREVRRTVDEEQHGEVIYRRTTIDEVEVRPPADPESASPPDRPADQPPDQPPA